MQAWYLAESKTWYCYNLDIYAHKQADEVDRNKSKVHSIVLRRAAPCNDVRHHLYVDNYYTSPAVLEALLVKKFGALGTVRSNRNAVPDEITRAKLKVGIHPIFYHMVEGRYIVYRLL